MSFKCSSCHQVQPDGTSPTQVVLKERPKQYPQRVDRNGFKDKGGSGYETVLEVAMCALCAPERHGK